MEFLYRTVVSVLVGHEKGSLDGTTVGVLSVGVKDVVVEIHVVTIDCIIKGDGDHLRHGVGNQVSGDSGSVSAAETVW